MGTPNLVHEAARQILEDASDIHGVLALAGRHDLMGSVIKIQKKAACILKLERPEVDIREGSRQDMMNAIGCLGHAINRNLDDWPDFNGEDVVSIIRLAEMCVKRGHVWLDMVVAAEEEARNKGYMKDFVEGDDECA